MDLLNPLTTICENTTSANCRAQVPSRVSDELWGCFRLRYSYFVERRGWVAANANELGIERDGYDSHSLHLAVSDDKGIVAYMRLLSFDPSIGFMLDRELSSVLTEEARRDLPRESAVELSRLVVRPSAVFDSAYSLHAVELLFRRFYQESKARSFRRFYIVVEPAWLRLFARRFGINFKRLGTSYVFPDGTKTVAATATLEELEEGMRRHSPAKFAWYKLE